MIFNSFQFIWLFPIIFAVYYIVDWMFGAKSKDSRIANLLLIAISYGLYMQWNPKYALVLLGVTAITYISARSIDKHNAFGQKKYLIWTGAFLALLPLLVFKYTNFILGSVSHLFGRGDSIELNLIAPIGISFFTFQAVGYLFDVYYKRTMVEKDWWDYMLFVCFFPQILSGPISRASELLPQIKAKRVFVYSQAVDGLKWLLWGMFMKTVFADRIGIYVNTIFDNYQHLSGLSCIIGAVLYSFQIYGDFAGYSFMAVGVGKLMGFDLINNFNRPYLASSITEFWKRWHISLTRWLTYNVYVPLGGNRCSKGRQYLNILITFLVSGIWHGANWTFVIWGGAHGVLQIAEKSLGLDPKGHLASTRLMRLLTPIRIAITFMLVSFVWIFFRMPSLGDAWGYIHQIFTGGFSSIATITPSALLFIVMAIFVVVAKDLMDEYLPLQYTILHNKYIVVRWTGYIAILILIMLCGVFDAGSFIYVNF